ncbi:MAG: N-acetylmuramoyl-L-alanine amidase [Sporichthyaceae bacterium]
MRGFGGRTAVALLVVAASAIGPGTGSAQGQSAAPSEAECPPELNCQFLPAAPGRFGPADRPRDAAIRYIVVHDTELSYDRTIDLFQRPQGSTSAHYLIRSADGAVTQFVANDDVGYHAGNFWFNMHSIGLEHEGFLVEGARWYTEEMYRASARLVRYLAQRYDIPLDREHILGHDEIAPPNLERIRNMHSDPGPYWNWERYFELLGAPLADRDAPQRRPSVSSPVALTLAPRFDENNQPFQSCVQGECTDLPAQGSSAVYLRTAPSAGAPLILDPVQRPDGTPGTTDVDDLSARASAGQQFVAAGRVGEWTAIWFAGQLAWFHDPGGSVGVGRDARIVSARQASVPLYGAAYPAAGDYPPSAEPSAIVELPYRLPAGQYYVGLAEHRSDDLATVTAMDGTKQRVHVVGERRLVEISFNHRRAFVDLADVVVLD